MISCALQKGIQTVINGFSKTVIKCLSSSCCQYRAEKFKDRFILRDGAILSDFIGCLTKSCIRAGMMHQLIIKAALTP